MPRRTEKNWERRREIFAREYLIDFNATRAAQAAGIQNPRTARQRAFLWLQAEDVQEEIARIAAERMDEANVTIDDVVAGLLTEARFSGEGSSHSARVAAWAHLGKYLNMFGDKDQKSGDDAFERIAAARARAEARRSGKLADLSEHRRRA